MTCIWCGKDVPDDKACPAGYGHSKGAIFRVHGSFHIECIWKAIAAEVDKLGDRPQTYWDEESKSYKQR